MKATGRDVDLPPSDFPPGGDVVLITGFNEAVQVLRSSQFRTGNGTHSIRVAVDRAGRVVAIDGAATEAALSDPVTEVLSWDELLSRGDLMHIDGAPHQQRRRAINPLFGRDAHLWFRDNVILPTLARNLSSLLGARDPDGTARADLVVFAKRVFVQASSALVGLDGTQNDIGGDAVIALSERIERGRRIVNTLPAGVNLLDQLNHALDGRKEFLERFYLPSLERRRQLLVRNRDGQVADDELPHDLLTLIADGAATFEESQAGLAVALSLIRGATSTNTNVLTHALSDLAGWFALHIEDFELRNDPMFLEGAVRETIRLHGAGTATFSRVATEDVSLSSGKVIRRGQYAALFRDAVNHDKTVFGPDADEFNPRRIVPNGVPAYGLGFGAGSHMCIGLPLVLGQGGITGMQVPLLQSLYTAGVSLDPARSATRRADLLPFRDEYATFPVIFTNQGST